MRGRKLRLDTIGNDPSETLKKRNKNGHEFESLTREGTQNTFVPNVATNVKYKKDSEGETIVIIPLLHYDVDCV